MLTYVGDDLYEKYISEYSGICKENQKFLIDNSDFINY